MGNLHSSSDIKMRDMGTPGVLGIGHHDAPTAGLILVEPTVRRIFSHKAYKVFIFNHKMFRTAAAVTIMSFKIEHVASTFYQQLLLSAIRFISIQPWKPWIILVHIKYTCSSFK